MSVLPAACTCASAWVYWASTAMKAGTSIITFFAGWAASRPPSRLSLTMLSETAGPSSGQTSFTAASRAAASTAASGRAGNTVSRVAMTLRWRSIIGE
jgi:hypothetical protein